MNGYNGSSIQTRIQVNSIQLRAINSLSLFHHPLAHALFTQRTRFTHTHQWQKPINFILFYDYDETTTSFVRDIQIWMTFNEFYRRRVIWCHWRGWASGWWTTERRERKRKWERFSWVTRILHVVYAYINTYYIACSYEPFSVYSIIEPKHDVLIPVSRGRFIGLPPQTNAKMSEWKLLTQNGSCIFYVHILSGVMEFKRPKCKMAIKPEEPTWIILAELCSLQQPIPFLGTKWEWKGRGEEVHGHEKKLFGWTPIQPGDQ